MLRPCPYDCRKCGGAQVYGTSQEPICPRCQRAYYSLEKRFDEDGCEFSIEDIIRAMIEDGTLVVVGVADDGTARVALAETRRQDAA